MPRPAARALTWAPRRRRCSTRADRSATCRRTGPWDGGLRPARARRLGARPHGAGARRRRPRAHRLGRRPAAPAAARPRRRRARRAGALARPRRPTRRPCAGCSRSTTTSSRCGRRATAVPALRWVRPAGAGRVAAVADGVPGPRRRPRRDPHLVPRRRRRMLRARSSAAARSRRRSRCARATRRAGATAARGCTRWPTGCWTAGTRSGCSTPRWPTTRSPPQVRRAAGVRAVRHRLG